MPAAASSTPDRLMTAARELIAANGHTVSVEAMVARAGLAKPTFYAHFDSKEALTQAVLEQSVETFFAALDAELATRDDPVERVLAPFDVVVAGLPDAGYRGCVCLNAAATFPMPDHVSHKVLSAHDTRLARLFGTLLTEAGIGEPRPLARQLVVLFDGVKGRGLVDRTPKPGRDAREAARTLVAAARPSLPAPS